MPPLKVFFSICEYFNIKPVEFFDDKLSNPELIHKAVEGLKELNDNDILMILSLINRLKNPK